VNFLSTVYSYFALSNPLHADIFPYVRKMEAEVVRMSCTMFNGGPETCGAMTSGGMESILMAIKTYRDWARERGISRPNIIAPDTAHAAFDKGAHYFDIDLIKVPVDPVTYAVDLKAVKKAINKHTIALVGSAPQFPHGIVDPIPQLSELAIKHNIGLHVDCCLGGFLLPFVEKLGYPVTTFDFRNKGVTTISADTHKYGYSPKGSSVILFSTAALRRHMFFVAEKWPGGIYATPSSAGSRPGAIIASTWAALMAMGEDGYLECAKAIMFATKKIEQGISRIEGIKVMGNPEMSVVAFCTDPDSVVGRSLNIYMVAEALTQRHWKLNTLQRPGAIHICCTYMHRDVADQFLGDIEASVKLVHEHPEQFKSGSAAIYGLAEVIDDPEMVDDFARGYLDALYGV